MSQEVNLKQLIRSEYIKCAKDPVYFMKKYCDEYSVKYKILNFTYNTVFLPTLGIYVFIHVQGQRVDPSTWREAIRTGNVPHSVHVACAAGHH